ncbi:hypothetical protein [Lentzea atacamensis]|uniref:hypothetical protein n=1 Tax=Lentzea atacamensis TaxID=531938 RepID=UPI000DD457D9|nr:hypothetical protein [Lentzea atacamensis]
MTTVVVVAVVLEEDGADDGADDDGADDDGSDDTVSDGVSVGVGIRDGVLMSDTRAGLSLSCDVGSPEASDPTCGAST